MPPAQIFVVRHSERLDKKNPGYSKTTARPHDPPITPNGTVLAEKLGEYLATEHKVLADGEQTIFLSSPLLRCAMTAQGIIQGLAKADVAKKVDGNETTKLPSIYIEPCLAESAYWQNQDFARNPAVAHQGFLQCPDPLYRTVSQLREMGAPLVADSPLYDSGIAPNMVVENNQLVEHGFEERCCVAAKALLASPVLDGKTVICISHGEASLYWAHDLVTNPLPIVPNASPPYTAFCRISSPDGGKTWVQEGKELGIPHLDGIPAEY